MTRTSRAIGWVTMVAALWAMAGAVAYACPICFQAEDAQVTSGIRAGVGVMIGITAVVLAGFGRIAIRIARNQK